MILSMNKPTHYMHNPRYGITIEFHVLADGNVMLTYQRTLDPNEECDSDIVSKKEARAFWTDYMRNGYKKVNGWHTCKRELV